MTIHTPAFSHKLTDDVRENVRQHRKNWEAPFRPGENLRVTTPILEFVMSKQTRADLNAMDPEYRARLEREWAEAAGVTGEPISDAIKARAAAEWEKFNG